ncbi:MAG: DUF1295 domain-containing protein [Anaerolineae bacterium]|jgi:protein-S-isoprenylcysteine O-methyltransferase Ste14|nr:DUF1295 domain-containing protein [Anaerolineae bacterium]
MLTILAGMLVFALLHSLTADARCKAWVMQRSGERAYHGFYRLAYNALSVLLLAPVALAAWSDSRVLYSVPPAFTGVLALLQLTGSLGLVLALLQIDLLRFAGVRQAVAYLRGQPLPLPPEALQTGGLYALVRHPLYLFALLALWCLSPMTETLFWFNSAATLYFIVGSWLEEQRMLRDFGAEYRAYQQRVPWMLPVPRPRRAIES